jgi:PAS domain S-box-containing protein
MFSKPRATPRPFDLSGFSVAVTEKAPLAIAIVEGEEHLIRHANPVFCELIGKPQEKLVGAPIRNLLPEPDECVSLLDYVYRSGQPARRTGQKNSNSDSIFLSCTMWPVMAGARPAAIIIQMEESRRVHDQTVAMNEALVIGALRQHELTEEANVQLQKQIVEREKTARELAEKARLVDLSNDAIIVHDLDNKIISWNRGAEKLYGWRAEEAIGKDLHSLVRAEFSKPMEEILAELHRDGQFNGEVIQIARNGRRVPTLCRWVLDRARKAVLSSYTDITAGKNAETELISARDKALAASKAKDDFLAALFS